MKVLNLYAGIGGNRKLWTDVEVTAVEDDPFIAEKYSELFPKDTIEITCAHNYLLNHIRDGWDFIWSSPPCPSHSIIRAIAGVGSGQNKPIYPDMTLWQEIIFLRHFFKGKFCVENVISYYEPLYRPRKLARHYFWANFHIGDYHGKKRDKDDLIGLKEFTGFYDVEDKLLLRNCVEPELGLHIFNESKREVYTDLFNSTQEK